VAASVHTKQKKEHPQKNGNKNENTKIQNQTR
jgi:hypothetical protein